MRATPAVLLVCAAAAFAAALAPACGPSPGAGGKSGIAAHGGKVPFVVGWQQGSDAARAAGRPMAILFTADW